MNDNFKLCQGVDVCGTENFTSAYKVNGDCIEGILSSELIEQAAEKFVLLADEPLFFFLELPNEDNNENTDIYYLDNCTEEVCLAIIKRYGQILSEDGISRFGFGSSKDDAEIYFKDYQEFHIYSPDIERMAKALDKLGVEKSDALQSMWDLLSDENVGCLRAVEIDGESVFDIPINLKSVGMYKSETKD